MTINIPTNKQLATNKKNTYSPFDNFFEFKNCLSHEFVHVVGINDGYPATVNGKSVSRITKNTETGYYKNNKFMNIATSEDGAHIVPNDIEMAINAQGMAMDGKNNSYQSYVTKTINGVKLQKSAMIRK